jgi:hypothetical protein
MPVMQRDSDLRQVATLRVDLHRLHGPGRRDRHCGGEGLTLHVHLDETFGIAAGNPALNILADLVPVSQNRARIVDETDAEIEVVAVAGAA